MYHSAIVISGSIIPENAESYKHDLEQYNDKRCIIEIKPYSESKTLQQLRYIHLILKIIGDELGYELDEIKVIFKEQLGYFSYVTDKSSGEILKSYKSFANFTIQEMSDIIEYLVRFTAEHSIQIPIPPEKNDNDMTETERSEFITYFNKNWEKVNPNGKMIYKKNTV